MPHRLSRIFILSHMRAYTSLLGHILGSHPAINGYYEMHQGYGSAQDLAVQVQRYTQSEALKPGSRFLLDKLLHNDYRLDLRHLDLNGERILLTLRPPGPTINSIVSLFAKKQTDDPYAHPARATQYYCERLQALTAFAQDYPGRYGYFDAELIRSDTPRLLAALQAWLGLDSPLSAQYQRFSRTGLAGAGDSSPAIHSGRVIADPSHYPEVLDGPLLEQATQAYEACRGHLIRNALAAVTD